MVLQSTVSEYDVVVVGGGNAGFCAAIAASESGTAQVLLIDKCPTEWAGGNSYFTAGATRCAHNGLNDLLPIVNNVDANTAEIIDMEPYSSETFLADLKRVTMGRADPELGRILVEDSFGAVKWLAEKGIRYQLSFNRQAYKIDGRYKFWGGLCLKTQDGGKGLVDDLQRAAGKQGVTIWYSTAARGIKMDPVTGRLNAVVVERDGRSLHIKAKAAVFTAGGFEANPRMRSAYLGPGWDLAHVRGTPHNTGEMLEILIREAPARPKGHWSGCHAVAWDANSDPNTGHREISNEFTKSGYPLGVTLNIQGKRFADEGSDLRNYTYAKFGRAILAQPQGIAFQVWDSKGIAWLRDEEYREQIVQRISAATIKELAQKLADEHGLEDRSKFEETITEYNKAVYEHQKENPGLKWDPAIKDGLSTQSSLRKLEVPKSNWALPLDKGPFMAVRVGCGVTFTFGGLATDPETAGLISNLTGKRIQGLYCAGEMMGGLFYHNYPGGSGLTSGTVFGRRAGMAATKEIEQRNTAPDG